MSRLAIRCLTTSELRAVMMPISTPERCSIFMPSPSREWKALYSWPSSPMNRLPSVSTPSTSKTSSLSAAGAGT